jgi:uncharacterized protein (DUF1800 family)
MIDPTTAWQPYEATADDPWDLPKVAHLHRRAGFSASWSELQRDLAAGPAASIGRLLDPPAEDPAVRQASEALWRAGGGGGDISQYSAEGSERRGAEWWLYRMTFGGDPLGEKLTLFWHNHFATALRGVYNMPLMLQQNATLRRLARRPFGELLAAIEADPAMLVWLDGGQNSKEHPNENFARELLELFTLGVGNYSEADVRAAARGLTGWEGSRNNLLQRTRDFKYREDLADGGSKSFLGQTGAWRAADILRIVLEQPAAANHLCRKLYAWFVDEAAPPSDELLAPLAAEYRASNYSTAHVVGIVLRSRAFFSAAAYRRRVKTPVEYCVGVLRQLEPPRSPNLLRLAAVSCDRQGQALFNPPSVKGWDGGRAWLNSNTTLMRQNWTAELLTGNARAALPPFEPADAASSCRDLLVDGAMSPQLTAQVAELIAANDADGTRAGLQTLLQSPEYQLA